MLGLGRLREAFFRFMFKPATQFAVQILGFYTLIWGLWLASPFWNVFNAAQLYANMDAVAPEISWGCSAIAAALIILYGAWRHSYKWTRVGGAVIFCYWSVISIMYFTGDFTNTGGITAALFCLWGAYIFVNAKLNREELFPNDKNFALRKKG